MISIFFNFVGSILTSLVRIIVLPINLIITNLMPDLSSKILEVSTNIESLFTSLSWGLGLVPSSVVITLLFILSVEIARYSIYISTYGITLVFDIIKRIKFW